MIPGEEKNLPSSDKKRQSPLITTPSRSGNQFLTVNESSSAILESMDGPPSYSELRAKQPTFQDVSLEDESNLPDVTFSWRTDGKESFILIDGQEKLQVGAADNFTSRLNCDNQVKVKVVSIFGNTGDGKSHTLNHIFFDGKEVFPESNRQDSCTLGVRAAFSQAEKVICLDTEGLLGATTREHQRNRLLLKVLAVSDLVIYRTRAERLHNDLYSFLGGASAAYLKHFAHTLSRIGKETEFQTQQDTAELCSMGPAVLIFHETRHTDPLKPCAGENSPEAALRSRFSQLKLGWQAFSSLRYVGQCTRNGMTDYSTVKDAIHTELSNTAVRSARSPKLVLQALRMLNEKFNGHLQDINKSPIPAEYFSCTTTCASCKQRCTLSMGHLRDGEPHTCPELCVFQHQYQNCQYLCTTCYNRGDKEIVIPKMAAANEQTSWLGIAKYAWSGYVLECPRCGVIYRSRQYWYGNKDPEQTVVRAEVCHVWENGGIITTGHNTARRVLDGVTQISEVVASVGSLPSKAFSSWVADQIAPKYWVPNSEIIDCHSCKKMFTSDDSKHHCRACGNGFCDTCSSYSRAVPERGWGQTPVRVCKNCHNPQHVSMSDDTSEEVRARRYGEVVINTLSSVASVVIDYPKELIKDSARPDYWVPDADIKCCSVCQTTLPSAKQRAHHCRDCGQGVCYKCSTHRIPVPRRGWDTPVRVCDKCHVKQE